MFKSLYCLIFSILIAVPVFAGENTGSISGEVKIFRARRSADVVVYLTDVPGTFKPGQNHPKIDQKNLIFMPHVLPVVVGTTVDFANNDNVKHNIYSPAKAKKFNLGTYGKDVIKQETFDKEGEVALACNVHAEMSAYIVVLHNPYFAKTENDGKFTMGNIPPGQYTLKTWHEKKRPYEQKITVEAGKTTEIKIELKR
ncbi:MAG TPA: methylamine utilization protein [Desulfobacterales bacterium]|nr:methylamine utilization protein [Desulfobacterales bacterium]